MRIKEKLSKNILLIALMAALILAAVFTVAFSAPHTASAEDNATGFASGSGTEADPYIITTPEQLDNLRNYLGYENQRVQYKLANDIDLTDYLSPGGAGYNEGAGWQPIGGNDEHGSTQFRFHGSLDGAGFKVTGLWINREEQNQVGLFGAVGDPAVKDTTLLKNLGVEISTKTFADLGIALTGYQNSWRKLTDAVGVYGSYFVGGLVGRNYGTVINSYSAGDVMSYGYFLGGLVGNNEGTVENSYSACTVRANYRRPAGGLVGENSGIITNCYAKGDITGGGPQHGGLVGNNSGTITNCYATGGVSGGTSTGGLVGENKDSGLLGGISRNGNGTITASFFDTVTTGRAQGAGDDIAATGVYGLSTFLLKNASTYKTMPEAFDETAWDKDVWSLRNGYYPQLKAFMCAGCKGETHSCDCENDACDCTCAICDGIEAELCPICGTGLDDDTYTHEPCADCGGICNGAGYTHICGSACDGAAETHTFGSSVVTAPTYTSDGYTTYTCDVCAYSYAGNTVPKLTYTVKTADGSNIPDGFLDKYVLGETLSAPSREGFAFDGWYLDKDYTQKITSVTADNLASDGSVTLYAKWTPVGSGNNGLSGGAIAGIVIGSVALAAIAGFAIYWFIIKKKHFSDIARLLKRTPKE